MPARITLPIDDPDAILATGMYQAGAVVRVESSADGTTYAEVGTVAVVSGTTEYDFDDPAGATGTYYRWRFSNSGGTRLSDYSDPVRVGGPLAYATVEDLRESLPDQPPASKDNYLSDLLVRASSIITERCGRDFFRHPQVSGTEIRYVDTDGSDRLVVPEGIVSLTTAEYTSETGGSLTALVAADWNLEPATVPAGFPYWSVALANGTLSSWYKGRRLARLTGVFGWTTVPAIIEAGTIALARELYVMQLHHLSEPNPNPWTAVPELLPRPTYEAINWGAHLMGHLFT